MRKKATLLVAEDDINIQDLINAVFHQYFSLIQVSDGEAAIEKIQSNQVDVAILDINIPKVNGLQVLKAIQKMDSAHKPATVVMSGDNSSNTISRAYDSGADVFISKPFDLIPLHKEVMNLMLNITGESTENGALFG